MDGGSFCTRWTEINMLRLEHNHFVNISYAFSWIRKRRFFIQMLPKFVLGVQLTLSQHWFKLSFGTEQELFEDNTLACYQAQFQIVALQYIKWHI